MSEKLISKDFLKNVNRYGLITFIIWTLIVVGSFLWSSYNQKQKTVEIVTETARSSFNKDQAYRLWATGHGGVYVEPTEKTPPSPWMAHIPDRDIETKDGKKLTLMNPAYMLREMMDDFSDLYGIKGRIVGIVYLNENNKADPWEEDAIRAFERGVKEKFEIVEQDGKSSMRLMRPMVMKQGCQKCHGHLGFPNGSIRGAVGVSVPLDPYIELDRGVIWVLFVTHLIIWLLGAGVIFVVVKRTKVSLAEKEEAEREVRLSANLFDINLDATCITDAKGKILRINPAYTTLTGYEKEECLGKYPSLLKSSHHNNEFYENLWKSILEEGVWEGEIWNRKKSGEVFAAWESIVAVKDDNGEILYFISTFNDITDKKEAEERIIHLAHYDVLTDLPNRTLFQETFSHALDLAARHAKRIVLLFLDLDGFKKVNDTLGHQAGDQLLIEIGNRIQNSLRDEDSVCRLGGDEFTIIIEDIGNTEDINVIAEKLLSAISKPFVISGREFLPSASIGISIYPKDGRDIHTLIQHADTAMYKAKESGKNRYEFYNTELTLKAEEYFEIENALKYVVENREYSDFSVFYQPKISTRSGEIIGMEALIRWRHPTLGFIPPDRFISIAEEIGVISSIDNFVLNEAVKNTKRWNEDGYNLRVSVNISGLEIEEDSLNERVAETLKEFNFDSEYLELEITESFFMNFDEKQRERLATLRDMNIKLSIDDFGTGYSSLGYLKKLPVDILKIDQSFVKELATSDNDKTLVATIIQMAHDLGLLVIAEGVEEKEHLDFLKSMGCDELQGYFIGKPMRQEDFEIFLSSSR